MKVFYVLMVCFFIWIGDVQADEVIEITGNERIEIAMQGESMERYQVPEGYILRLQTQYPGVMIQNHEIVITPEAKASIITLVAQKDDQQITKEVLLEESWTKTVEGAQQYLIPDVQETRRIQYMDTMMQYLPVNVIRYGFYFILLSIYTYYIIIRKKK